MAFLEYLFGKEICKNCKYWRNFGDEHEIVDLGECTYGHNNNPVQYDEKPFIGNISTKEYFGCVLWEDKKDV